MPLLPFLPPGVPITIFFYSPSKNTAMAHPSGHGFITDIMPIAYHSGCRRNGMVRGGNPMEGHVLPEKFRGTGREELTVRCTRK
jgi:hypothetical protein